MNLKLYKIGHLANLLGITHRTIRYYDQCGFFSHMKRSEGGIRLFDDHDIEILKKIRYLQKTEYLPLEVIKKRLLSSKTSVKGKIALVIDGSSVGFPKDSASADNIHVIPLSIKDSYKKSDSALEVIAPSVDQFIALYMKLAKLGVKYIYSLHSSNKLQKILSNAQSASHKVSATVRIQVIDSNSSGPGLSLLTTQIADAIQKEKPPEDISLLIKKSIPLVSEIIFSDSISFLYNHNTETTHNLKDTIVNELGPLKPILKLNHTSGKFEVVSCHKKNSEAISKMLTLFEEEIGRRKKCLNKILINYGKLYSEAITLANGIKEHHPNIEIAVKPGSPEQSAYLGHEFLNLGFM